MKSEDVQKMGVGTSESTSGFGADGPGISPETPIKVPRTPALPSGANDSIRKAHVPRIVVIRDSGQPEVLTELDVDAAVKRLQHEVTIGESKIIYMFQCVKAIQLVPQAVVHDMTTPDSAAPASPPPPDTGEATANSIE